MAALSSLPLISLPPPRPISPNRPRSLRQAAAAADIAAGVSTTSAQRPSAGNGESGKRVNGLSVLYDDGYGTASVKDYFAAAKEIIRPDGGPPRWFCPVECGQPIEDAPVMFFLPGIDGTGMGLIMHHKSLGKVFEVRCLHIPVNDRTPFEGLVKFVEKSVKDEHTISPHKPIYLVGDSFGGCLALAIAARNRSIDLVLILVNPATSFGKSQLLPFLPFVEALPDDFHSTVPYLLSFIMGDPVKMAMANVGKDLPPPETLQELSKSLTSLLPLLSDFKDILPKDTFLWKLRLLRSGPAYTNSRLHAVEAEVLLLASGKDGLLPSGEEADRLRNRLKNCRVRYFKDSGHTLLLEDGFNLLSIMKGTITYRRLGQHDFVTDYLPPSISDFRRLFDRDNRLFRLATSAVMFSTLENGRIVKGLDGVPDEGPVLLVGIHALFGLELHPLYEAFLREKNIIIRGMAHPILFRRVETSRQEVSQSDVLSVFGAIPVSPRNMYSLFSRNSHVLLYPGGAREALHRKGEEYKLFWPEKPEFVRMATRFGATIIPFGVVGEDDLVELVLDYNDQTRIPFVREWLQNVNKDGIRLRMHMDGEVANQEFHFPAVLPKLPGRYYYLFGKPFKTLGKEGILKDRESANKLYLEIKSEIEGTISYLKAKREEDPYRGIVQRTIYQTSWGSALQAPSFDP